MSVEDRTSVEVLSALLEYVSIFTIIKFLENPMRLVCYNFDGQEANLVLLLLSRKLKLKF